MESKKSLSIPALTNISYSNIVKCKFFVKMTMLMIYKSKHKVNAPTLDYLYSSYSFVWLRMLRSWAAITVTIASRARRAKCSLFLVCYSWKASLFVNTSFLRACLSVICEQKIIILPRIIDIEQLNSEYKARKRLFLKANNIYHPCLSISENKNGKWMKKSVIWNIEIIWSINKIYVIRLWWNIHY